MKVFIDGEAGTTGLQIQERLVGRRDLELLQLDATMRKDLAARRDALNAADIAILCLPDDAAREATALVENPQTCVIDASTAHRTAPGWTYGFPEYAPEQRQRLCDSKRISNPGCYAVAAVSILHPLVQAGLVPADWPISINAVSGYSGGGKALIEAFAQSPETPGAPGTLYDYGLGLAHKHLPEITRWGGLARAPIFLPAVARYYQGMLMHVPLATWSLPAAPAPRDIHHALCAHYGADGFVEVVPQEESATLERIDPEACNGTNKLRLYVLQSADESQAVVVAQLDNLGKGASGQAVQTLNLIAGVDEALGLIE